MMATFVVAGFLTAAVYAAGMMRGRRDHLHRLGFSVPFAFAAVAALFQPVIGHVAGMRLDTDLPTPYGPGGEPVTTGPRTGSKDGDR